MDMHFSFLRKTHVNHNNLFIAINKKKKKKKKKCTLFVFTNFPGNSLKIANLCLDGIFNVVVRHLVFFFFFFFFHVITPAGTLRKSTSGRHRPVSYPDGPMTARYRFT